MLDLWFHTITVIDKQNCPLLTLISLLVRLVHLQLQSMFNLSSLARYYRPLGHEFSFASLRFSDLFVPTLASMCLTSQVYLLEHLIASFSRRQ